MAARVQRAVDDLDGTIRQIRSTIFALHAAPDAEGLRGRLRGVVDAAGASLGFAPAVRLDGLLDTAVGERTGEHLLAVVREALSNVARHARASAVLVSIEVGEDLTLLVEDDGVGLPAEGRHSGLRNIQERARELGGRFEAGSRSGGGTLLVWRVPLGGETY